MRSQKPGTVCSMTMEHTRMRSEALYVARVDREWFAEWPHIIEEVPRDLIQGRDGFAFLPL